MKEIIQAPLHQAGIYFQQIQLLLHKLHNFHKPPPTQQQHFQGLLPGISKCQMILRSRKKKNSKILNMLFVSYSTYMPKRNAGSHLSKFLGQVQKNNKQNKQKNKLDGKYIDKRQHSGKRKIRC